MSNKSKTFERLYCGMARDPPSTTFSSMTKAPKYSGLKYNIYRFHVYLKVSISFVP